MRRSHLSLGFYQFASQTRSRSVNEEIIIDGDEEVVASGAMPTRGTSPTKKGGGKKTTKKKTPAKKKTPKKTKKTTKKTPKPKTRKRG